MPKQQRAGEAAGAPRGKFFIKNWELGSLKILKRAGELPSFSAQTK